MNTTSLPSRIAVHNPFNRSEVGTVEDMPPIKRRTSSEPKAMGTVHARAPS